MEGAGGWQGRRQEGSWDSGKQMTPCVGLVGAPVSIFLPRVRRGGKNHD